MVNPNSYQKPLPMFRQSVNKMTTSPARKEIEVKTPPKKKSVVKKSYYNPGSAIRSRTDKVNTFSSRQMSNQRPKSQIEEIRPNKTPPKKAVIQPLKKKTLKDFLKVCKKMLDQEKYQECKTVMESAIRNKQYGEIPQDPRLFLYCAMANSNLGYLIIAEQLLKRCLVEPEIDAEAQKEMAKVYKE